MDLTEKLISRRVAFEGKIMRIDCDEVRLPNGRPGYREVCRHVGGVAVLPVDEEGNVYLVRQYRYPYEEVLLEIPAGKLDKGEEDPLAGALRELREETGLIPANMRYLGQMYPSPGFLEEALHLYLATGLTKCEIQPDDDEFVELVSMKWERVEDLILRDEIRDAKTIAAIFRAKLAGELTEGAIHGA